LLEKFGVTI